MKASASRVAAAHVAGYALTAPEAVKALMVVLYDLEACVGAVRPLVGRAPPGGAGRAFLKGVLDDLEGVKAKVSRTSDALDQGAYPGFF